MNHLLPALSPDQLFPAHAGFMARTDLYQTRMLGLTEVQLDTAASLLMGLLNGRAVVRHMASAGPEIIDLFLRAGIKVDEQSYLYRTEAEARAHANGLVNAGYKLFGPFPPPDGFYPDSANLVNLDIFRFLNAKQNLAQLVPQNHLASQLILTHDQLADYEPSEAVCLKSAGDAATGWGYAVFPCLDREAFMKARAWFQHRRSDIPAVLVEEWIDVDCCWCIGLAINETATLCFGGAEQLFSAPGKQSGSLIDSGSCLPAEGETLAVNLGETARRLGFRGIAGLDIGRSVDGRFIVFDPNFRLTSSASQLLFHHAVSERSGLPVSRSFQITPSGSFDDMACRLHGPIDEGWFVPTRIFNGEKHPLSQGKHIVTGFVVGADRDSAMATSQRLKEILMGMPGACE